MILRTALNLVLVVVSAASATRASAAVDVARAAYDAGHYTEAHTLLDKEASGGSNESDVYYWLARCDLELRNFDDMIAHAERAVELSPDNSDYHLLLGRAYGRKAEHHANWFSGISLAKKIRNEFERAVELNPRNIKAQRDLANFYARAPGLGGGGDDKAQRKLGEIQALDSVQGHLARMDYFVDKKQWDQAGAECRFVESANSRSPEPYDEIAEYYESRDDGVSLERVLELAARNGANDSRFDYYRGAAAAISGENISSGEAALKRYLKDVPPRSGLPSHSNAHVWLGKIYEKQRQHDAAASEYREALKLDSNNKAAREALKHTGG
jgi:tetratricopeptide (TPR) repeat protein